MSKIMPYHKYRAFTPVALADRTWPSKVLERAPRWCSVDLRDGNQALVEPMGIARKLRMFEALVAMGFKEIEVGFPAASQPDYDFVRKLIEEGRVPRDVAIQVLTQARPELIDRTMEAVRGARTAIVHLYNSTSTLQRRVVFGLDRAGVQAIAVAGAERIRALARQQRETEIRLEYSPESFTGTELDFARDVCDAVVAAWAPSASEQVIINLPATVEMSTPNVYADQIEWMGRALSARPQIVLSVHPHNDRGTAVAAAELAVMAGADRVEGTLFGNGERTGNVCVVTLAMNLFSQGVDPELDLSDMAGLKSMVEHVNRLPVHPRHPYAGELVFTAFSGSHQDAIKKGLGALRASETDTWEVPYLPIDPADVGRTYEAVVRVNSQSGKSGVAFVLESDHGYALPKALAIDFARHVQQCAEREEAEVSSAQILALFEAEYVAPAVNCSLSEHHSVPAGRVEARGSAREQHSEKHRFELSRDGKIEQLEATGSGPLEAFVAALSAREKTRFNVTHFAEHALERGNDARAVTYVCIEDGTSAFWGVGVSMSTLSATLAAAISAIERRRAALGRPEERGTSASQVAAR